MIVFRADSNAQIGMGHYARCMKIARAAAQQGQQVLFVTSADSEESPLIQAGFSVRKLGRPHPLGWDPAEAAALVRQLPDVRGIFLDSYRVDAAAMQCLRAAAPLYYLDDLYAFDYPADVLINYNLEATPAAYRPTAWPGRREYLGARYFPAAPELCRWRKTEQQMPAQPEQVLLTSGSADPLHCTEQILQALRPEAWPRTRFQVLVGKFYDDGCRARLAELARALPNVRLLPWGQDMGRLLHDVDLVISPGATTVYESFVVGTPCVSYQFADNQKFQCEVMARMGMAPYGGAFQADGARAAQGVADSFAALQSRQARQACYRQFAPCFDGKGAARIAQIVCGMDK